MSLLTRISMLERLAARIPEVNHENVEAIARFLKTGDERMLPKAGVDRAETLMVARSIPDEDADAYPGLAKIAEALDSSRRIQLVDQSAKSCGILYLLKHLEPISPPTPEGGPIGQGWVIMFWPERGEDVGVVNPTPGEFLLQTLGLILFIRINYGREKRPTPAKEHENAQKGTDS